MAFWRNRRVLLTGHTGFKGGWLALWLKALGARVHGLALPPPSEPSLWQLVGRDLAISTLGDIRDPALVARVVAEAEPEILIHMAAQPLVRASYADPVGTLAANVLGTAHILDAARAQAGLRSVLVVTSDKVYENNEAGRPFAEGDRLGGHDPYSSSKACAELVTQCFRDSFWPEHRALATARAGNVIGGGDWAADRLVPDCVRALDSGQRVVLRYPDAVRPWQHVLEPLGGYLVYAEALTEDPAGTPKAMNFGPDPDSFRSVAQIVDSFSAHFAGKPGWASQNEAAPAEAKTLTLSSALAERSLVWRPRLDLERALQWTAGWYRAHRAKEDMVAFSMAQIEAYEALAHTAPRKQGMAR
jgi:CDP-glucose 4,6-dehydratase